MVVSFYDDDDDALESNVFKMNHLTLAYPTNEQNGN